MENLKSRVQSARWSFLTQLFSIGFKLHAIVGQLCLKIDVIYFKDILCLPPHSFLQCFFRHPPGWHFEPAISTFNSSMFFVSAICCKDILQTLCSVHLGRKHFKRLCGDYYLLLLHICTMMPLKDSLTMIMIRN